MKFNTSIQQVAVPESFYYRHTAQKILLWTPEPYWNRMRLFSSEFIGQFMK